MLNQVRMAKRKKYLEYCSLDEDLGKDLHRIDIVESKKDEIADCEFQSDFQDIYSRLSDVHKKIIKMRLNGMTQKEMSEVLKISQPSVARNLAKIKNKLVFTV